MSQPPVDTEAITIRVDPGNPNGHIITVAIADVAHYVHPGSALDQAQSQPLLDVRDVPGHRRLTDAQLPRGGRERAPPRDGGERTQPRFEIHNLGL